MTAISSLQFDDNGLIPVVTQQHDTGEVLMLGWMNSLALEETLRTGLACYWSRSRNKLWRKGETSRQWQYVVGIRVDCDHDCLLLLVNQQGVACHTGRRSCFYKAWNKHSFEEILPILIPPETLYPS